MTSTIDLWACSLDGERSPDALSASERRRAAAFAHDNDRRRFVAAHVRLREILARYLDCRPQDIEYAYGAHGKPRIAGAGWAFNVSHRDGRMLVAVTGDADVGVDLERDSPLPELPAIVARFFAPAERACFAALAGDRQRAWFYRQWVAKEAVVKAHGAGLSIAPDTFTVEFDAANAGRVRADAGGPGTDWIVQLVDVGPGWHAAVACGGPGRAVRFRSLDPPEA